MSGPIPATFDALYHAMVAVVQAYPPRSSRPDWVENFVLAVGSPAMLAEMRAQVLRDAEDAKRWRERPVAPPPVPGGRSLLQLVAAVQAALSANMEPPGPADHETLAALAGLMDCAEQRAAEGQAQQDETDGELWRFVVMSADPDGPTCKLMESISAQFEEQYEANPAAAFFAHVAEGLRLSKVAS